VNAREAAFGVLLKMERDGAYSNLALDGALKSASLSAEDSALAAAIVYTATERRLTIDYNLSLYLTQPLKKLRPEVLTALRAGCAQIFFMDRIPASAAVNESVKLVKRADSAYAAGLVNAVLRKAARNGPRLPKRENGETTFLSVKYSCPEWLVKMWSEAYGAENAEGIMAASLEQRASALRVNTLKTTPQELTARLRAEGVETARYELLPNVLLAESLGAAEKLRAFSEGLFHVQDVASGLCCMALGACPGETVMDVCAAPGGKSFTIAQEMRGEGFVKAFDLHANRVGLIESGAARLGIGNIRAEVRDAARFDESVEKTDRILCDVPCSGFGVIDKKPEIRYKTPQDIDKLPDLQYLILCVAAKYLKTGGRLVYSTCTLNPAENEDVCERFLNEHPDFKAVPVLKDVPHYGSGQGFVTLMPHVTKSDGFFIAAFTRIGKQQ